MRTTRKAESHDGAGHPCGTHRGDVHRRRIVFQRPGVGPLRAKPHFRPSDPRRRLRSVGGLSGGGQSAASADAPLLGFQARRDGHRGPDDAGVMQRSAARADGKLPHHAGASGTLEQCESRLAEEQTDDLYPPCPPACRRQARSRRHRQYADGHGQARRAHRDQPRALGQVARLPDGLDAAGGADVRQRHLPGVDCPSPVVHARAAALSHRRVRLSPDGPSPAGRGGTNLPQQAFLDRSGGRGGHPPDKRHQYVV